MATPGPEVSVGQGTRSCCRGYDGLKVLGGMRCAIYRIPAAQSRALEKWAPWFHLAIPGRIRELLGRTPGPLGGRQSRGRFVPGCGLCNQD